MSILKLGSKSILGSSIFPYTLTIATQNLQKCWRGMILDLLREVLPFLNIGLCAAFNFFWLLDSAYYCKCESGDPYSLPSWSERGVMNSESSAKELQLTKSSSAPSLLRTFPVRISHRLCQLRVWRGKSKKGSNELSRTCSPCAWETKGVALGVCDGGTFAMCTGLRNFWQATPRSKDFHRWWDSFFLQTRGLNVKLGTDLGLGTAFSDILRAIQPQRGTLTLSKISEQDE